MEEVQLGEVKAYLDLIGCVFELDGTEDFVAHQLAEIRELVKSGLLPVQQTAETETERDDGNTEVAGEASALESGAVTAGAQSPKRKARQRKRAAYKVLTLDLHGKDHDSLQDFVKAKNPRSGPDRLAVVAHWLKTHLKLDEIGFDHVYTCYKTLNWPVPASIRSALKDAARRNGYFDGGAKPGLYRLTVVGENRVEHVLPEQAKNQ